MRMAVSLRTLRSKIDELIHALRTLQERGVVDEELLRRVGKICSLLPDLSDGSGGTVTDHLDDEVLKCTMLVYMSLVSKNAATLSDLSEKYTLAYGRRSTHF